MPEGRHRLGAKVAIVTGAGGTGSGGFVGIGQATSILFAREGARVLLEDRDHKNAEVTLAAIKEQGGEASLFVVDVTSNADCREMAGDLRRQGLYVRRKHPLRLGELVAKITHFIGISVCAGCSRRRMWLNRLPPVWGWWRN